MIAVCILGILTVLELIVLIFFGWGVDPANGPQLADHAYGLLFLIAAVLALFALLVLFSVGGAVGRKQDLDYKVDVLQRRVWQMEGKIFASRQSEPASASPAGRGAALPGIRYPAAGPCPGFPGMLYPANLPAIPRAAPGNVPSAGNPAQPPRYFGVGPTGPATPSYLGERHRTREEPSGPADPFPGESDPAPEKGENGSGDPARPDGPAA